MLEEWSKTFIWLGLSTTQTFHSSLPGIPSAEVSLDSLLFLPQSLVQFSHVWLFATPRTAACQASLSITNSRSLLKLMSITSVIPSNHLIICHHLLLLLLQCFPSSGSFPLSQLFTSEGWSIRVSALALVLRVDTQGWLTLGWTGLISLESKGLSRVFSSTTI